MVNFLTNINFIGSDITFTNNSSSRHKTIQGALISLIILVTSVILGTLFGKEIYERKIPNTSTLT